MSDPLPAPTFSGAFDVKPTDIGAGYAAGISSAGTSVAGAIGGIADIAKQNIDTNDTLTAMKQGGILKDDEYQAVMGKSLGAKQQMLGLYAGQYIADQAERRAAALQSGKAAADIATEHAKLLDMIDAVKKGYGPAVGVSTGKLPAPAAPRTASPQPQQPAVQPAQPAYVGTNYNPVAAAQPNAPDTPLIIGPSLGQKDVIPIGAKAATLKGQKGYLLPDGITFRPLGT
jgi:hypothetical protein